MKRLLWLASWLLATFPWLIDTPSRADHIAPVPAFRYNGVPAREGDTYTVTVAEENTPAASPYRTHIQTLTTADGTLQVRQTIRSYKAFPVQEWDVALTNRSATEPTGIIHDFRSLQQAIGVKPASTTALHVLRGSTCTAEDFAPETFPLASGTEKVLATTSGRSSNDFIPFLDLSFGETSGALFAIGWTGSWKAQFRRNAESVDVALSMERTHFRLLPGETIRQPSITVFTREGQSRRSFQTVVHRFMREHKSPRDAKGAVIPPILAVASGGGNKTPQMMADVLQYVIGNKMPFDTYWVDAGWYGPPHEDELYSNCGPNWSKYVGD